MFFPIFGVRGPSRGEVRGGSAVALEAPSAPAIPEFGPPDGESTSSGEANEIAEVEWADSEDEESDYVEPRRVRGGLSTASEGVRRSTRARRGVVRWAPDSSPQRSSRLGAKGTTGRRVAAPANPEPVAGVVIPPVAPETPLHLGNQRSGAAPIRVDHADRFEDWSTSDSEASDPEPEVDGTGYWRPRRGAAAWAVRAAARPPQTAEQSPPRQRRGGWNITSVNLDGADVTQPDLAQALRKCMNTSNGRGGVIMLQDVRRTEDEVKSRAWRFWETSHDLQAFIRYAPGVLIAPSAAEPGPSMPMGGQLVMAYGEAGERAQAVKNGCHPQGLWSALLVRGRGLHPSVLYVSAYRPPADDLSGASLVARIALKQGQATVEDVHRAFGEDLREFISQTTQTYQCEVVLGADFNHE